VKRFSLKHTATINRATKVLVCVLSDMMAPPFRITRHLVRVMPDFSSLGGVAEAVDCLEFRLKSLPIVQPFLQGLGRMLVGVVCISMHR